MLLSKETAARVQSNAAEFQSLFFWMLLSKQKERGSWVFFTDLRFQSLFFWMLLSKQYPYSVDYNNFYRVSILIFLDASL